MWLSLHSQKLLSRGLAEKLVNTVFKVYTLFVKIKALKIVDRDSIWFVRSIIVYWWLKFVLIICVVSFTLLPILSSYNSLFILFNEIIRLGKD